MTWLNDKQIRIILERMRLQEEQAQILAKNLRKVKVNRLMIRQVIVEQDQPSKELYFLLQGSVHLITTLVNGEKGIVSEITQNQFFNTEIFLNSGKSKYTITASSSFIRYVTFQQKNILLFSDSMKQQFKNAFNFRQKQIVKRNKKIQQQTRRKKMQQQIGKLSLPNIDLKMLKKNPNLINTQDNLQQNIKTLQNLPVFSKSLKNVVKSSSLQKLPRYEKLKIENIEQHNVQSGPTKIVDLQEFRDKISQKKFERLKSERSISLNQKYPKEIDYSRNEKLFKEQLKNIVRRKIIFQRKHFKVLKKLNNKDQRYNEQEFNRQILRKVHEQNDNPIDNYFNL